VTVVSHASSSSKIKIKEKRKENQYKIRKIKEKKNKIVSVQVSYNISCLRHQVHYGHHYIKLCRLWKLYNKVYADHFLLCIWNGKRVQFSDRQVFVMTYVIT